MRRTTRRKLVRAIAYALVLAGLITFGSRLTLSYNWDWGTFLGKWIPLMLRGLWLTIQVAFISLCVALPLGITVGLCRTARDPVARFLGFAYVEVVRGTPLLVQIFIWFYVFAEPLGLGRLGDVRFVAAVCALSCFTASYIAEIVRAGIQSVDRGQMEAARSLGLSHFQAMRTIVLPQALRRVLPPLASEFIALVKDSSLASVIGLEELTKRAQDAGARDFLPFESYLTAAALYLMISIILSFAVRLLEHKLGVAHRDEVIR